VIKIREPIWKTHSIGISEGKLATPTYIQIDYRDKTGELLFPYVYTIDKEEAKQYPCQVVRGVKLRIIPIFQLHISNEPRRQ